MTTAIPTIIRFALSLITGYLGYLGIESGDLTTVTVGTLITSGVVAGVNVALKYLDGTKYGNIAKIVIGPKVGDLTKSLVRSAVTALAGATYGWLNMSGADIEHATLLEVLTLLVAAAFSKGFRTK